MDGRTYQLAGGTTTPAFEIPCINIKRAAAARKKHGLDDFRTWASAVMKMEKLQPSRNADYRFAHKVVPYLADREQWMDLLAGAVDVVPQVRQSWDFRTGAYVPGKTSHLDNIMSFLRREVYKVEDVVDADDLEYLTSMKEAAQWKQAGRRIDWA
jgi:hypothetical protein